MPADLTNIADLSFILLAWGGGLLIVSGVVAIARIPGPGFTWVTVSVAALIGLAGVLGDGAWWARAGLLGALLALLWARNRPFSGVLQIAGALCFLVQAAGIGGALPAISAGIALGGVTGEMLLGHWYLVDPRLPRSVLRALAIAGIIGLAFDTAVVGGAGLPDGGAVLAYWALVTVSVLLMVGVIAAIRYPAYSGVMAATGLSYLAVLTTLGGVFLGRALVAGLGPFAN